MINELLKLLDTASDQSENMKIVKAGSYKLSCEDCEWSVTVKEADLAEVATAPAVAAAVGHLDNSGTHWRTVIVTSATLITRTDIEGEKRSKTQAFAVNWQPNGSL